MRRSRSGILPLWVSCHCKIVYFGFNVVREPPWYGTVCPVVWEDGGGNPASYPIVDIAPHGMVQFNEIIDPESYLQPKGDAVCAVDYSWPR